MVRFSKTLIVGATGSGKSYGIKNLNPETTGIINIEYQELPFDSRKFKNEAWCKTYLEANKALADFGKDPKINCIVFDSLSAYFESLADEANKTKKGFDVWKMYNEEIRKLLNAVKFTEKDMFLTAHYEILNVEGNSEKRVKVKGKELEGVIEREFVNVFYANKKYNDDTNKFDYYLLLAGENLSAKCPPHIFGEDVYTIKNDYQYILDAIIKSRQPA